MVSFSQESMTRRIFSPYRICPIGAHVDHQGGLALGRTVELGTELTYTPSTDGIISIVSDQFGEAQFNIGDGIDHSHWIRYAQAAAEVLGDRIKYGIKARVRGPLAGAGLSSSASVGLAYLKALANANGIELSLRELVELDHHLETGQLGLQNGLLDPLTIVHGRKDAMLLLDTFTGSVTPIEDSANKQAVWIIAYSGISRELTKSGFNQRVEECRQAAGMLKPGATNLSAVPFEDYDVRKKILPTKLRLRAEHYFDEVDRVKQGAQAWANGDIETFGQLMNQSCRSSIRNYESGSPEIIELHEVASTIKGILGSRFSGGGYGGCVIALAEASRSEDAARMISEKFQSNHPDLHPLVFVASLGGGLR